MWQGSKVLWNETRGRKFHGTFVPGDESISSPGTKVPDTVVTPGTLFHYTFDHPPSVVDSFLMDWK